MSRLTLVQYSYFCDKASEVHCLLFLHSCHIFFPYFFFSSQLYNLHNYVLENAESGNHRGSEVERRKSFKFTGRLGSCKTDEKVLMP